MQFRRLSKVVITNKYEEILEIVSPRSLNHGVVDDSKSRRSKLDFLRINLLLCVFQLSFPPSFSLSLPLSSSLSTLDWNSVTPVSLGEKVSAGRRLRATDRKKWVG